MADRAWSAALTADWRLCFWLLTVLNFISLHLKKLILNDAKGAFIIYLEGWLWWFGGGGGVTLFPYYDLEGAVETLIWLRVSLTCCTYVLGEGGLAMTFSIDKSTSLEGWGGGQKKPLRWSGGGFKKMKGKNKEIIIAHPIDKLWMLPNHFEQLFFTMN